MRKLIVLLIVLAFAAAPASANMVTDGGFEFGGTGEDLFTVYPSGTLGAWTCTADTLGFALMTDSVDQIVYQHHMPEGNQAMVVAEGPYFGYIQQSISGFTIGQTYELTLAAMTWSSDQLNGGHVEVYDSVADVYDLEWDFAANNSGYGTETVEEYLYSSAQFTASATDLTLSIIQLDGGAVSVDDVSIELIPEPATICLLGLGGLLLRRKR